MYFFCFFFIVLSLLQIIFVVIFINLFCVCDGFDFYIVYYDGFYYFMMIMWIDFCFICVKIFEGFKMGEIKVVWIDINVVWCCNVWVLELYRVDGVWYIYYMVGNWQNFDGQWFYVVRGGVYLWDGQYFYVGQVIFDWGIDGMVLMIGGKNYFIWLCLFCL